MTATTEMIPPGRIHTDGGTQPRAKIDMDVCHDYAERMTAGDHFDPITVYFDGEAYWLADGFHRLKAHLLACNEAPLECEVFQGTREDAQWLSYSANKSHGLRRTNEDKARALQAALVHPKSKDLSDSAIADHVGIRRETVLRYRHRQEPDLLHSHKSTTRTGRDGRTINTTKIGTNQPKKAKSKHADDHISPRACQPKIGHSEPRSVFSLQFSTNSPEAAAATLLQLFPRTFIETLIEELTHHLSTEGVSQ